METKKLLALIPEVSNLLLEIDKTYRYPMSQIYDLYNRVYGTNETPQSCGSCLIRKVIELRGWLTKAKEEYKKMILEPSDSSDMDREVSNNEEA